MSHRAKEKSHQRQCPGAADALFNGSDQAVSDPDPRARRAAIDPMIRQPPEAPNGPDRAHRARCPAPTSIDARKPFRNVIHVA